MHFGKPEVLFACLCHSVLWLQEHFEREAARFAAFDDDGDMFADDDEENKPEAASTSIAPPLASLLSTPRVSFSFPDVRVDSNGGTPRLHPADTSHSPQHPHQEAATESVTNRHHGKNTFSNDTSNGHVETDGAQPASEGSMPAAAQEVDYQSWPAKELHRFLSERGVVRHFILTAAVHAHLANVLGKVSPPTGYDFGKELLNSNTFSGSILFTRPSTQSSNASCHVRQCWPCYCLHRCMLHCCHLFVISWQCCSTRTALLS